MIADVAPGLVSAAAVIVLVGAGLARRRLPARRLWTLAAIWAILIAAVWLVVQIGLRFSATHFT